MDETLKVQIIDAITSDEEDESQDIEKYYIEATQDQQKAIDRVFIAMCGYSLRTMISGEDIKYNPYE